MVSVCVHPSAPALRRSEPVGHFWLNLEGTRCKHSWLLLGCHLLSVVLLNISVLLANESSCLGEISQILPQSPDVNQAHPECMDRQHLQWLGPRMTAGILHGSS